MSDDRLRAIRDAYQGDIELPMPLLPVADVALLLEEAVRLIDERRARI